MLVTFGSFGVHLSAETIFVAALTLFVAVNVQLEFGRAAVRLSESMQYLVECFLLRSGTDGNRLKIQLVEIDEFSSGLVVVDHEVAVVLVDDVELLSGELAGPHSVYELGINVEYLPQGGGGFDPVNRLIELVGVLHLAVPQDGPQQEQHDHLNDGIFAKAVVHAIFLGTVTDDVEELNHQLLHLAV